MTTNIAPTGITNPFHISRAYALGRPTAPAASPQPTRSVPDVTPVKIPETISKVIAGTVPGKVGFDVAGGAAGARQVLRFYTHPADRNAAATSVNVGRHLDISG